MAPTRWANTRCWLSRGMAARRCCLCPSPTGRRPLPHSSPAACPTTRCGAPSLNLISFLILFLQRVTQHCQFTCPKSQPSQALSCFVPKDRVQRPMFSMANLNCSTSCGIVGGSESGAAGRSLLKRGSNRRVKTSVFASTAACYTSLTAPDSRMCK